MNVTLSEAELAFQQSVRNFFESEYPQDILDKVRRGIEMQRDDYVRGMKALYDKGWAGVNWPVEYGGTGWSATEKYLFYNEMARAHAPFIVPFGLNMVGPVIYTYGNDEQKQRFLPDILRSDVWWCQGYSEPGAGSDLASLKTRAVRDGDDYVVNGTKTWTTWAQHADWMFFLVRTNTDVARQQEGISFLLVDMKSEGISVEPIITIDGDPEVNQVFFDNVRVPVANRIGDEGKGWSYAKMLLTHERTNIADVARSRVRLAELQAMAADRDSSAVTAGDAFRRKLAQTEIQLLALEYTDLRTLASVATGQAPGPESSILKIKGTEMQQALDTLYLEAAGYHALPNVREQFDAGFDGERIGSGNAAFAALKYFNFRKASIYGGSNEIQKNIIAKAVLGI